LLVTANVPSSPIPVTVMKEALRSSETSILTRAIRRTSQKTEFFIVIDVKTSNLTHLLFVRVIRGRSFDDFWVGIRDVRRRGN
jgi:hypothetical protein